MTKKTMKKPKRRITKTQISLPTALGGTWVDRVMEGWNDIDYNENDKNDITTNDMITTNNTNNTNNDDGGDDNNTGDNGTMSTIPSSPSSSSSSSSSSLSVGIICWNVLADSYCSPRSHQHLPKVYQNHVFDNKKRRNHVRQILKRFATGSLGPDFIALQEVDTPLDIPTAMSEYGYIGHHTPTDPTGRTGRVDSCALYIKKETWKFITVEMIVLDDLATLCSTSHELDQKNDDDDDNESPTAVMTYSDEKPESSSSSISSPPVTRANLIGIEMSFLRKNMALLVRVQHLETGQEIVVAVAHLFWNPLYQDVKLCQAHYVSMRAHTFAAGSPILWVGDTNSQPGSAVHQYLTKGKVNARAIAPWYHSVSPEDTDPVDDADDDGNDSDDDENNDEDELVQALEGLAIDNPAEDEEEEVVEPSGVVTVDTVSDEVESSSTAPRYLLDFTLNRLCRWLRILGIDAALETEEEERRRTKDGQFDILDRCRKERRTLITSSNRLVMRKDCPPGTYRLASRALVNLELSLVHLLLTHGVEIQPKNILSTCVVCNGRIDRIKCRETIEQIFIAHNAPQNLNDKKLKVWQCSGCKQGYWVDERPTSSASRVKNQATKLLKLCIRGGVPVSADMDLFDHIDVNAAREEPIPDVNDKELCRLKDRRPDILDWLQQKELTNSLGPMKNVYSDDQGDEQLGFTNVTAAFVGHLDYILHDSNFRVVKQLYVPTTFEELQDGTDIRNGHLLPSNIWPSDHLAIGAVLTLPRPAVNVASNSHNFELEARRVGAYSPDGATVDSSTTSPGSTDSTVRSDILPSDHLIIDAVLKLPLSEGSGVASNSTQFVSEALGARADSPQEEVPVDPTSTSPIAVDTLLYCIPVGAPLNPPVLQPVK